MTQAHQVDHLLLLVGSNPIPNAVAGKLLVKSGGTITLVCSKDSLGVAQRLKQWLSQDRNIKVREPNDSQIDPANPSSIFQGVRKALENTQAESVGLNYTGGTKAMSVHAYRAVEQWCKEKSILAKFSYLDARTLSIIFDPEDPISGSVPSRKYVGNSLQIALKDLCSFHDWQFNKQKLAPKPTFPKTANQLKMALAKEKRLYAWKAWVNHFRADQLSNPNSWPDDQDLCNVLTTIQEERDSCEAQLSDRELQHWIQGKWLEDVVLSALIRNRERLLLHECCKNIETRTVKFELDVAAIRGYQLFAFSCSTKSSAKANDNVHGHKAELKQKLFEAFIRARQLGGDEARVALVCLYDDPDGLRAEMRRDVDPEGHIQVFGYKHLSKIDEHIAHWIERESGEGD